MNETFTTVGDEEAPPEPATLSDSATSSTDTAAKEKDNGADRLSDDRPLPSISKLLYLARPEFPELAFACLLMVGSEATSLITPLVVANAYNTLVDPTVAQQDKMSSISWTMILVLIIHFSGVVANFVQGSILGATGERVVARLRNQLYSSILKQEMAFFDEHKTGELVSRLGSDTTLVQQATSNAVPRVILGYYQAWRVCRSHVLDLCQASWSRVCVLSSSCSV